MPPQGYTKRRSAWTREEVISKLQEWHEAYGQPPTSTEWNPSDCMRSANISAERTQRWAERSARFHEGEWPWTGSVAKLFGTWNAALTAAELPVNYRRTNLDDKLSASDLDSDDLRKLLDEADELSSRPPALRAKLCELAERALAWAQEIDE